MLKSKALICVFSMLAACFLMALTTPADAQQWRPALGWSWDYNSKHAADAAALGKCGSNCRVAVTFRNACGAIAVSNDRKWFGRWAPNSGQAQSLAMSACRANSHGGCYIPRWQCSGKGHGAIAIRR